MFKQNKNKNRVPSQTTLASRIPPLKSFLSFSAFLLFLPKISWIRTRASLFRKRKKDEPRVSQPVA